MMLLQQGQDWAAVRCRISFALLLKLVAILREVDNLALHVASRKCMGTDKRRDEARATKG